jgi:signal peptidase I
LETRVSQETTEVDLDEIAESLSSHERQETQWGLAVFAGVLMALPIALPWYYLASNTMRENQDFTFSITGYAISTSVIGYQCPQGILAGLLGFATLGLAIACRQQAKKGASIQTLTAVAVLTGWLALFLSIYAFGFYPRGTGDMGVEGIAPAATITAQLGAVLFLTGAGLFVCAIRAYPRWIQELIRAWGPAILIVLTIRNSLAEPFRIPSGSMVPTLEVGDHILVSKISYGFKLPFTQMEIFSLGEPEVGDVIVFRYPVEPFKDYIKRVVAGPGDTIELKKNTLYVNGVMASFTEEGRHLFQNERCFTANLKKREEAFGEKAHEILVGPSKTGNKHSFRETKVPEGHYFVMGDNRHNSEDSRWWGFVPREHIKGKAKWIWLSYNQCEGNLPVFGSFRGGRFGEKIR